MLCKNYLLKLQTYNIYIMHQPLETDIVSECVLWVIFFVQGYWQTIYGQGCMVQLCWEYETIFNTKYFQINSKVTTLCSCYHSLVLTDVYMYTHTNSCLLEYEDDTYTHHYPPLISHAQTCIHFGSPIFLALPEVLPLHTQTSSYLLEIWLILIYAYAHSCPCLIACINRHSSFMLTGAFPLHACRVTRNMHIYFTNVGQVF